MRPVLLKFSAFGPYAGQELLDFSELKGRGFFLIHGPTGAGKTTILDAICYALYGDSSGNLRDGRTMRSDHAGAAATEVDFTFAVGDRVYRVWRSPEQERAKKRGAGTTLSPADAALFARDASGEKLLAHGYGNTTAQVEALLGFKSGQFRQVVLLPQGEFRRLLLANSAERQEIMQALFRTELYRQIEENLKQRARAVEQERRSDAERLSYLLADQQAESPAALEAAAAAGRAELAASEARVRSFAERQARAQSEAAAGRAAADKFAAREKAAQEKAACEALAPEVEKYRLIYRQAQQAAQLADLEAQRTALAAQSAAAAAEEQRLTAAQAAAAAAAALAERALAEEEAKAPLREAAERRVLALDGYGEKLAQLTAARAELAQRAALAEAADAARQAGAATWQQAKERAQAARAALQEQTQRAAAADALRTELAQARRAAEQAEELAHLTAAIGAVDAAHRAAAEEFQRRSAQCEVKRTRLLRLQHLFAEGQAALLARALTDGAPCPVCGATRHPRPALGGEELPSEAEVKAAQREAQDAEQRRREAQDALSAQSTQREALGARAAAARAALGDDAAAGAALREREAQLQARAEAAEQARAALAAAQAQLQNCEAAEQAAEARQAELAAAQQSAHSARQAAQAVQNEREAALPEEYRAAAALESAQQAAARQRQTLQDALAAARRQAAQRKSDSAAAEAALRAARENLDRTRRRGEAQQAEFARRLTAAGFDDEAAYGAAKQSEAYRSKLEARIRRFDERIAGARHAAESAQRAVAGLDRPDMAALEARAQAALHDYNQAFADCRQLAAAQEKRREKCREAAALAQKLAALDELYGAVGTLAEVAGGKNAYGMTFQRFVLRSLLEDVIDASNLRLKMMSRGQYMLQGSDARARKNAAGGLDLAVFDHYTGCARPVHTLSGGETFLASLALALGLADVVQSYAGGIRLDTILVDEGFGTLDPESLDIALKALIDLQRGGRLVGIISHVPELRERIDARLEVTKGRSGSTARFCVG